MTAGQLTIGTKFTCDNTSPQYGHTFYSEVTDIKVTKSGRIKAFLHTKYKSPKGEISERFNVPFFNGAYGPETIVIDDRHLIN